MSSGQAQAISLQELKVQLSIKRCDAPFARLSELLAKSRGGLQVDT